MSFMCLGVRSVSRVDKCYTSSINNFQSLPVLGKLASRSSLMNVGWYVVVYQINMCCNRKANSINQREVYYVFNGGEVFAQ